MIKIQILLPEDQLILPVKSVPWTERKMLRKLKGKLVGASPVQPKISASWSNSCDPVFQISIHEACCFMNKEQISVIREFGS